MGLLFIGLGIGFVVGGWFGFVAVAILTANARSWD